MGKSAEGRVLQVIRLDPPPAKEGEPAPDDRPTILVDAMEHATEGVSAWTARGMLDWLLSDAPEAQRARAQCHWLFIPMLDPDGAAHARFGIGDVFTPSKTPLPEAMAFAAYLANWLDAGHRLDVIVSLYNLEGGEMPLHLICPFQNENRAAAITAFNRNMFAKVQAAGFLTGDPAGGDTGLQQQRLFGWAYRNFAGADLELEVNDRNPARPAHFAPRRTIGRRDCRAARDLCNISRVHPHQVGDYQKARRT